MEAKEMLGKKYGRLLVKDYKVVKVQGEKRQTFVASIIA